MMHSSPKRYESPQACAEAIIDHVGKEIVLGLPLGVGKPNHLVNAFYEIAAHDPTIRLRIFTALTLDRPVPSSDLERRLMEPILERLLGKDYPDLTYAKARREDRIPPNIAIEEFFLTPASLLNNAHAQRHYISTNYTHGGRDVLEGGLNVLAQMVRPSPRAHERLLSLSSNPDLSLDLIPALHRRRQAGHKIAVVGEINDRLPYLANDAAVPEDWFDGLIEPEPYALFGPIAEPVSSVDHAIGFNCAALVRDGGTLQIGFGSLGDAVANALILRHCHNDAFRAVMGRLDQSFSNLEPAYRLGGLDRFEKGLYGCSEMVFDGFLHLLDAGVLTREVYEHTGLQQAINDGRMDVTVSDRTMRDLLDRGLIAPNLTEEDLDFLRRFHCVSASVRLEHGRLVDDEGDIGPNDMSRPDVLDRLCRPCVGGRIGNGRVLEGAFYVGTRRFYERLRAMNRADCARFNMTSVRKINDLYGNEGLRRIQRVHARFFNTALMVTALGGVVSDGLEDGRVISGVGGQHNFVSMAHELQDGRSIIALRATRTAKGNTTSNILWNYGHITVPRHLRDVVVTEYGIADLRGGNDRDIIVRLLNICDSRFQDGLLEEAKRSGKIEANYTVPGRHRANRPERLEEALRPAQEAGNLARFPFGSDLTETELALGGALRSLKDDVSTRMGIVRAVLGAFGHLLAPKRAAPYLERMGLAHPRSLSEKVMQMLVVSRLRRHGHL